MRAVAHRRVAVYGHRRGGIDDLRLARHAHAARRAGHIQLRGVQHIQRAADRERVVQVDRRRGLVVDRRRLAHAHAAVAVVDRLHVQRRGVQHVQRAVHRRGVVQLDRRGRCRRRPVGILDDRVAGDRHAAELAGHIQCGAVHRQIAVMLGVADGEAVVRIDGRGGTGDLRLAGHVHPAGVRFRIVHVRGQLEVRVVRHGQHAVHGDVARVGFDPELVAAGHGHVAGDRRVVIHVHVHGGIRRRQVAGHAHAADAALERIQRQLRTGHRQVAHVRGVAHRRVAVEADGRGGTDDVGIADHAHAARHAGHVQRRGVQHVQRAVHRRGVMQLDRRGGCRRRLVGILDDRVAGDRHAAELAVHIQRSVIHRQVAVMLGVADGEAVVRIDGRGGAGDIGLADHVHLAGSRVRIVHVRGQLEVRVVRHGQRAGGGDVARVGLDPELVAARHGDLAEDVHIVVHVHVHGGIRRRNVAGDLHAAVAVVDRLHVQRRTGRGQRLVELDVAGGREGRGGTGDIGRLGHAHLPGFGLQLEVRVVRHGQRAVHGDVARVGFDPELVAAGDGRVAGDGRAAGHVHVHGGSRRRQRAGHAHAAVAAGDRVHGQRGAVQHFQVAADRKVFILDVDGGNRGVIQPGVAVHGHPVFGGGVQLALAVGLVLYLDDIGFEDARDQGVDVLAVAADHDPVGHDLAGDRQVGGADRVRVVFERAGDDHVVKADAAIAGRIRVRGAVAQDVGADLRLAAVDHDQAVLEARGGQIVAEDDAAVLGRQIEQRAVHHDVAVHLHGAFFIYEGVRADDLVAFQILVLLQRGFELQLVIRRADGTAAVGEDGDQVAGQDIDRAVFVAVLQRSIPVGQPDGDIVGGLDVGLAVRGHRQHVVHAVAIHHQLLGPAVVADGRDGTIGADLHFAAGLVLRRQGHDVIEDTRVLTGRGPRRQDDLQIGLATVGNDLVAGGVGVLGRGLPVRGGRADVDVVLAVHIDGDHVGAHLAPDLLALVDGDRGRTGRHHVARGDVGGDVLALIVAGSKAALDVEDPALLVGSVATGHVHVLRQVIGIRAGISIRDGRTRDAGQRIRPQLDAFIQAAERHRRALVVLNRGGRAVVVVDDFLVAVIAEAQRLLALGASAGARDGQALELVQVHLAGFVILFVMDGVRFQLLLALDVPAGQRGGAALLAHHLRDHFRGNHSDVIIVVVRLFDHADDLAGHRADHAGGSIDRYGGELIAHRTALVVPDALERVISVLIAVRRIRLRTAGWHPLVDRHDLINHGYGQGCIRILPPVTVGVPHVQLAIMQRVSGGPSIAQGIHLRAVEGNRVVVRYVFPRRRPAFVRHQLFLRVGIGDGLGPFVPGILGRGNAVVDQQLHHVGRRRAGVLRHHFGRDDDDPVFGRAVIAVRLHVIQLVVREVTVYHLAVCVKHHVLVQVVIRTRLRLAELGVVPAEARIGAVHLIGVLGGAQAVHAGGRLDVIGLLVYGDFRPLVAVVVLPDLVVMVHAIFGDQVDVALRGRSILGRGVDVGVGIGFVGQEGGNLLQLVIGPRDVAGEHIVVLFRPRITGRTRMILRLGEPEPAVVVGGQRDIGLAARGFGRVDPVLGHLQVPIGAVQRFGNGGAVVIGRDRIAHRGRDHVQHCAGVMILIDDAAGIVVVAVHLDRVAGTHEVTDPEISVAGPLQRVQLAAVGLEEGVGLGAVGPVVLAVLFDVPLLVDHQVIIDEGVGMGRLIAVVDARRDRGSLVEPDGIVLRVPGDHVGIAIAGAIVFDGSLLGAQTPPLYAGVVRFRVEVHQVVFLLAVATDAVDDVRSSVSVLSAAVVADADGDAVPVAQEHALVFQPRGLDRAHQHLEGGVRIHRQRAVRQVDRNAGIQVDSRHGAVGVAFEGVIAHRHHGAFFFDAGDAAVILHVEDGAVGQLILAEVGGRIPGYLVVSEDLQAVQRVGVGQRDGAGAAGFIFQRAGQRDDHRACAVDIVDVAALLQRQSDAAAVGDDAVQLQFQVGRNGVIDVVHRIDLYHLHRRQVQEHIAVAGMRVALGDDGIGPGENVHVPRRGDVMVDLAGVVVDRSARVGDDPRVEGMILILAHAGSAFDVQVAYPQRAHRIFIALLQGDGHDAVGAEQLAALVARPPEGGRAVVQRDIAVQGDVARARALHEQLRFVGGIMLADRGEPAVDIHPRADPAAVFEVDAAELQVRVGGVGHDHPRDHGLVVNVDGAAHGAAVEVGVARHGAGDLPDLNRAFGGVGEIGLIVDADLAHLRHGFAFALVDVDVDAAGRAAQVQHRVVDARRAALVVDGFAIGFLVDEAAGLPLVAHAVAIQPVNGGAQLGADVGEAVVDGQVRRSVGRHPASRHGVADGVQLDAGVSVDVGAQIARHGGSVDDRFLVAGDLRVPQRGAGIQRIRYGVLRGDTSADAGASGVAVDVFIQRADGGIDVYVLAFDDRLRAAGLAHADGRRQRDRDFVHDVRNHAQTGGIGVSGGVQVVLGSVADDVDRLEAIADRDALFHLDGGNGGDLRPQLDVAEGDAAAGNQPRVGLDVVRPAHPGADVQFAVVRRQVGACVYGDLAVAGQLVLRLQHVAADEADADALGLGGHGRVVKQYDVQRVVRVQRAGDVDLIDGVDGVGTVGFVGVHQHADGRAIQLARCRGIAVCRDGDSAAGLDVRVSIDVRFGAVIAVGRQERHLDFDCADVDAALQFGFRAALV